MIPRPTDLGLPNKFVAWRKHQEDAILKAVSSSKRFVALALPTGSGKSLTYMAVARLLGERTAILTSTKGLQNQLGRDFGSLGLADIRGQNNYDCQASVVGMTGLHHVVSVESGPCHVGYTCKYRDNGCAYFDQVRKIKSATLVTTNYSYWAAQHLYGEGLGEFGLLILDEAHEAPDELAAAVAVELRRDEIDYLNTGVPLHGHQAWASILATECRERYNKIMDDIRVNGVKLFGSKTAKEVRLLRSLINKLSAISNTGAGWVSFPTKDSGYRWECVWPREFNHILFRDIPKIIFTSATIRQKTLEVLGVKDYDFQEYPSSFPVERRPVIHVETAKLTYKSSRADIDQWLERIDQVIAPRLDRKGIIHTVSYKRAEQILRASQYGGHMTLHTTSNVREVVEQFKLCKPPAILVSPSLGTGWDFPDDQCRWQIIAKVPFADPRDEVLQERVKTDPDYAQYLAMVALVQTAGRGVRGPQDWCETLVLDDNVVWFVNRYRRFAPRWFLNSVVSLRTLPKPLDI